MGNVVFRDNFDVVYGQGSIRSLAALLSKHHPTSILAVSSGEYVDELGVSRAVHEAARAVGATVIQDKAVVPNPRVEHVRDLIAEARRSHVDFVLAAGGGSSIDTAKAVGIGLAADRDIWEYYDDTVVDFIPTKPVGVISTIPGTGSEVGRASILTNEATREKRGAESDSIRPVFTIVDPDLSRSVPQHYQAAAIADEFAHLFESYITDDTDSDLQDHLIAGAIATVLTNGRKYADDPSDDGVRAELHKISLYQHFLSVGRRGDWGGHPVEHAISGLFDILHGEGLAVVTPAWIRYAADRKPAKIRQLTDQLFGTSSFAVSDRQVALDFADTVERLFNRLGLKTRLSDYGITSNDLPGIAAQATKDGTVGVGSYLPLDAKGVEAYLALGL